MEIEVNVVEKEGRLQFKSDLLHTLYLLSSLYATNPSDKHRNGTLAVRLATKGCELTNWKDCIFLETLAASYAETGEFSRAIDYQTKAIECAPNSFKNELEARLKLYRSGKKVRDSGPKDPRVLLNAPHRVPLDAAKQSGLRHGAECGAGAVVGRLRRVLYSGFTPSNTTACFAA
jgi:hypothetical protein